MEKCDYENPLLPSALVIYQVHCHTKVNLVIPHASADKEHTIGNVEGQSPTVAILTQESATSCKRHLLLKYLRSKGNICTPQLFER